MTEHEEIELTSLNSSDEIIIEKPTVDDSTSEQESTKDEGEETDESCAEIEYADYQGPEANPELFQRVKDAFEKYEWLKRVFRIQSLGYIQAK